VRRREFITLLGGGAAWPIAAGAQQPAMPVIGYLDSGSAYTSTGDLAAFREGLRASGYEEGQNVAIEYRWGDDHNDRLPELAAELVRHRVAVLAALGTPTTRDGPRDEDQQTQNLPPSSSLHQSDCGCALMSPRPS